MRTHLIVQTMQDLLTVKQASLWASNYLSKDVSTSNISYLIQYGRVKKHGENGTTLIHKSDLIEYYQTFNGQREANWRQKLGRDLNWALSFDNLREKDTTKHVHRLHPYKGKFIPQLVEYFLDDHTDEFKSHAPFKQGDIILDPFVGSGTTLVQANELGIHAIGIDISAFNSMITNTKISPPDFKDLSLATDAVTRDLKCFAAKQNNQIFEDELLQELNLFNKQYFPTPEYKIAVKEKEIDEATYSVAKEAKFLPIFKKLQDKHRLQITQSQGDGFLGKWYLNPIRYEIDFVFEAVKKIENPVTKKIMAIILSRTLRTCRATTHADLATLKDPVTQPYYCRKHGKICKPLFSISDWWQRYCADTIKRLSEFDALRTPTMQRALQGDARCMDIFAALSEKNTEFGARAKRQKIRGIFSSPPYIGLIDYHEQHAYAYELFGFQRNDEAEIGPLFKGQSEKARMDYAGGIAQVLNNAKPFLEDGYDIFLVANDKYNLYPEIAKKADMQIVNQYKRPVLNRTERDKSAYAEAIFHMKEK